MLSPAEHPRQGAGPARAPRCGDLPGRWPGEIQLYCSWNILHQCDISYGKTRKRSVERHRLANTRRRIVSVAPFVPYTVVRALRCRGFTGGNGSLPSAARSSTPGRTLQTSAELNIACHSNVDFLYNRFPTAKSLYSGKILFQVIAIRFIVLPFCCTVFVIPCPVLNQFCPDLGLPIPLSPSCPSTPGLIFCVDCVQSSSGDKAHGNQNFGIRP